MVCFLALKLRLILCTLIVSVVGKLEDQIRSEGFVDLGQIICLIKQAVFSIFIKIETFKMKNNNITRGDIAIEYCIKPEEIGMIPFTSLITLTTWDRT